MQINTLLQITEDFRDLGYFKSNEKNQNRVPARKLLSYPASFVSSYLDSSYGLDLKFRMKGFFLDSSIDIKIKSAPAFIFTLQRYDARETYVSCFYAESYPELFKSFNDIRSGGQNSILFFNWFSHESLVPRHPLHRDEISNVFYYNEGRFLDYRVFDSTEWEVNRAKRLRHSLLFRHSLPEHRFHKFVKRNRFYKRKFNWFLKNYA